MNKGQDKFCVLLIYCLLAAATLVVYEQVRHNEFLNFDDYDYITGNQHVQSGLNLKSIRWAFSTIQAANWHPLTMLSHILDCRLFGLNPKWHHLVNLLFHTINTLLLFRVLKDMTGALWKSAFVAALFALHPLHVESVAWMAERKDVLSTMFWMLTMAGYLRYVRLGGAKWYVVTLFLFALGLLAKPMLVTLPFVLLLLDYWPLGRLQNKRDIKSLAFEKLPFFALSAASSIVTFIVQHSSGAVLRIGVLPLSIRIANTPVSYVKYIFKMFWPARLAVYYPYEDVRLSYWVAIAAALVLLGVSVLAVRSASKHRYLPVGWFWYLGTLVPVIGLVQVGNQALADRYTYVPLTGLFIIIAWALPELLADRRYRKIVLGISAAAVLFALSVCTYLQIRCWRNNITLFTRAIAVTKNNYLAHNNLGFALQSQGKIDEAMAHYRKSLNIYPAYEHALFNMGFVLHLKGKPDEAVDYYRKGLLIKPDYADAHYNLGLVLKTQGKSDEAMSHLRQAIKLQPDFAQVYNEMAGILLGRGKFDEAVDYYRRAVQVKPDYAEAHYNLGTAFASQGRFSEAAECFQKALHIKPDYAEAHSNLGAVLKSQGRLDEAINHYEQAMKVRPDSPEIHNNLGNALLAQGRTEEAINHFRLAVKYRPDFAEAYFNLGSAFQSQGRFDEAEKCYRQALRINPNHTAAGESLRKLLKNTK
jgi:tetratricopeptide (TPR) repeat protein